MSPQHPPHRTLKIRAEDQCKQKFGRRQRLPQPTEHLLVVPCHKYTYCQALSERPHRDTRLHPVRYGDAGRIVNYFGDQLTRCMEARHVREGGWATLGGSTKGRPLTRTCGCSWNTIPFATMSKLTQVYAQTSYS